MSDLFEKSIRTLELPAVLERLASKATSEAAKERCLHLWPATDADTVAHLLDETDAAKERLGLHGSPSFTGVKDVAPALRTALDRLPPRAAKFMSAPCPARRAARENKHRRNIP